MTITASDQDEALRTVKLLDRTIERLSEFKFPELEVVEPEIDDDDDDDDYDDSDDWVQFKCPWCRHTDYIECYSVVRIAVETCSIMEPNSSDDTSFMYDTDDSAASYTEAYLKCDRCDKPVSLPAEYSVEAD